MSRRGSAFLPLAAVFVAVLVSRANASPPIGAPRPDISLRDAWDRQFPLSLFRTMPVLVIYEDKGSVEQNAALKEHLSQLAKGDKYKKLVALVAVADVTGYDYWPVRGFVKNAIQKESHKQGTIIYCDWDGSIRTTLGLERGRSNVVLYGRDGRVLFSEAGALSEERRRALIGLLRTEVEG